MTRTITITSGKGGVGKTNISVNLALHLASLGRRTCLFDADLGLANVNVLLGLYPEYNIDEVILNNKILDEIIIKNHLGIDIIPGSSGVDKIANLEGAELNHLLESFTELKEYDYFLFDTSAGISRNVICFCLAAPEVVLVITPEPTSLTDAYAMIKVLCWNGFKDQIKVIVNQCRNTEDAKRAYNTLKSVVVKNFKIDLTPIGIVMHDAQVAEAIKRQTPFITLFPETVASRCIKMLTQRLMDNQSERFETRDMVSFWKKCFKAIRSPLHLSANKESSKQDTAPPQPLPEQAAQEEKQGQSDELEIRISTEQDTVKESSGQDPVRLPAEKLSVSSAQEVPAPETTGRAHGVSDNEACMPAGPKDEGAPPQPLPGQAAQEEKQGQSDELEIRATRDQETVKESSGQDCVRLPAEKQGALSSEKQSFSQPIDTINAGSDVYPQLQKLIDSVRSVSDELNLLRKTIQSKVEALPDAGRPSGATNREVSPKAIVLNFNTFMENRLNRKGKSGHEQENN